MKYKTILLTLLAAVVLLSSCRSKPEPTEAKKITTPLAYHLTGSGNKTLVFIHGWLINQTYWDAQVEFFKPKYKVLTLDLAGHGNSTVQRTDWTIETYADDVADLLTKIDADSLIMVGHSMSGNIALHVYDKIPDKVTGFVGIDNLKEPGKEMSAEEQQQTAAFFEMLRNDFSGFTEQYAAGYLFPESTPDSIKQRVIDDFQNSDPEMAVKTLESLQLQSEQEKILAPKLKIPMHLIVSDNGERPLVNDESLQKYAGAGYKVWPLENTGHYPMIEKPDEFNRILQQILSEL